MMKTIVITGSTRGIGLGLAKNFVMRGCQVVISGRSLESVQKAIAELAVVSRTENIHGFTCDVTQPDQVQALWDFGVQHFGKVDIWINNAGIAHPRLNFWELGSDIIQNVITTNTLGAAFGSRVAIQGFLKQNYGALYNLEGFGSDGRKMTGMSIYGTSKAGLHYLNQSLVEETRGTPILVGMLRPGMVATDLITRQYEGKPEEWERAKKILNHIAEKEEKVSPWLVERILENTKTGIIISYSSSLKIMWNLMTAPISKRKVFD